MIQQIRWIRKFPPWRQKIITEMSRVALKE